MGKKTFRRERTTSYSQRKKKKVDEDIAIEIKPYKSTEGKKDSIQIKLNIPDYKKENYQEKKVYKTLKNIIIKIENNNQISLKTVEELHLSAKKKFNEIKNDNNINYEYILNKILCIYDLDEEINLFFLNKLDDYYQDKKVDIDNSKDGTSDRLSKLFFDYIYTINFESRKKLFIKFNYFGKNEIFRKSDKKYMYQIPLNQLFRNFIKELLDVSSTIKSDLTKRSSEQYLKDLAKLYSKYIFPDNSFHIPIKYGNEDLMFIHFIDKFQTIFCEDVKRGKSKEIREKFFRYDISTKFLALNCFSDYFSLPNYDILSIQYILFCLHTFFMYYDQKMNLINIVISDNFAECSAFLYQSWAKKKEGLKKIKKYIANKINIDDITEDYMKNNYLIIKYCNKEIKIKAENCFFYGDENQILNDLLNENSYNFQYLKNLKFPLFCDKNFNDDFYSHMKAFLQSPIITEYTNTFKGMPLINQSLFSDKIFEEIKSNTMWVKFPLSNAKGITDRDTYTIFLNNENMKDNGNKLPNVLAWKTITVAHEDSNHILRLLLNINGFGISRTTPKKKDIYKIKEFNDIRKRYEDQGDIWEKIFFGEKISSIFIMSSLFILDTENFNLKINNFKNEFQKLNCVENIKSINQKIKSLKMNTNNKLAKYIKEYNSKNDKWVLNNQSIVARNISYFNMDTPQSIPYGFCGTHAFDNFA